MSLQVDDRRAACELGYTYSSGAAEDDGGGARHATRLPAHCGRWLPATLGAPPRDARHPLPLSATMLER